MADDKLFHALVSRLASRESTSMTFSAISSSASLVLLAFSSKDSELIFIPIFGLLFPIIGFVYFELTNRTIHKYDHYWIKELIKKDDGLEPDEKMKIFLFTKWRQLRIGLTRFLLLFPVMAWSIITPIRLDIESGICLSIIGVAITSIAIIVLALTDEIR